VRTWSYWRYALFSGEAIAKLLAAMGVLYLFVDIADAFKVYTKDKHSVYGAFFLLALAVIWVITKRRPVSRVSYKVPKKDFSFEVKIGDSFKADGEIIISSNSTFDTDMSSGLISPQSLQGQFALQFFGGRTAEIDQQLDASLRNEAFTVNETRPGKKKEYPIGTVAKVHTHGKNFYFVAMSHMMPDRNAYSDTKILDQALEFMWPNIARKAELGEIVIPLLGTGRGRVALPRKKIVERIAQSFADASADRIFSNKLTIVVPSLLESPSDVRELPREVLVDEKDVHRAIDLHSSGHLAASYL
jgi:hypothetical protein